MANANVSNFAIPTSTNVFSVIWKLTRALKAAGWTYKASANGAQKETSGTAANDLWGGSATPLTDTYTTTSVLSTGSQALPVATLNTATSPITAGFPTSGTLQVATTANGWQTLNYTGTTATSFTGVTGGTGTVPTGAEIGNNAITLEGVAAWWVGSGPQTLRITITAAPTGTPLRNEIISQATSAATGELLGYCFDTASNTGWMVILPQTGTFDGTHTITGGTSAATFTPAAVTTTIAVGSNGQTLPQGTINAASTTGFPSAGTITVVTGAGNQTVTYTGTTALTFTGCTGGTGLMSTGGAITGTTVVTYNREIVFGKTTGVLTGQIDYICADNVAESASLFSSLTTSAAGCTATVWPGGGGTGNTFPTVAIAIRGTSGGVTGDNWMMGIASFSTSAQIGVANATPASNVSADGSFFVTCSSSTANQMAGFVFTRVDDGDPGDIDPYVWLHAGGASYAAYSRTANAGSGGQNFFSTLANGVFGSANPCFFGYQARGVSLKDFACGYGGGLASSGFANTYAQSSGGAGAFRLLNHSNATPPIIREPVTLYTPGTVPSTTRHFKGRTRWIGCFPVGNTIDTFDSKNWVAVTLYATGNPVLAFGPYDGTTTPVT